VVDRAPVDHRPTDPARVSHMVRWKRECGKKG